METTIVGSFIGVGFLTVVNVAVIAYSYGKMSQSVRDLSKRVERIENIFNHIRGG